MLNNSDFRILIVDDEATARRSLAEILELAREHRPFLTGVTVSGGEPTKQLDFVIELFRAIKSDKELAELSCFIDSNGYLGASGWESLLPSTDGSAVTPTRAGRCGACARISVVTTRPSSSQISSARPLRRRQWGFAALTPPLSAILQRIAAG